MSRETFESMPEGDQFIAPCILRMRITTDRSRLNENPYYDGAKFSNAGDGDMLVTCDGNEFGCPGATVNVDRHDILQATMPETCAALAKVCTSSEMHFREPNTKDLRPQEVDHSR